MRFSNKINIGSINHFGGIDYLNDAIRYDSLVS